MALQLKMTTYTSTGNPMSITGIGFQPKMPWTHGVDQFTQMCFTHAGIQPDQTLVHGGADAIFADGYTSIDADGFSLGTDTGPLDPTNLVNDATPQTYWVACFAGSDVAVGNYAGNGGGSQAIAGLGFSPAIVCVKRHDGVAAGSARIRHKDMPANNSFSVQGSVAVNTDAILSLDADGFTVGSSAHVNAAAPGYSYWAFKEVTSLIAFGTYAGDGTSNRIIAVGFQPKLVLLTGRLDGGNTKWAAYRYDIMPAAQSALVHGSNLREDYILDFTSNGFKVGYEPYGGGASLNEAGETYYWMAIGAGAVGAYSIVY